MSAATRSVLLAVIGGMMAVAYLTSEGVLDLSFGFPEGGVAEGVFMAVVGGVAGYAVLLAFRKLRSLANRDRK